MGSRIKEAIKGSEKSQAAIARECGVTPGAVTQWVKGEVDSLKAETVLALEKATGYRARWLLHGTGAKKVADRETIWPFPLVPFELYEALDLQRKGYVQSELKRAITEATQADRDLLERVSSKSDAQHRKIK